MLVDKIKQKLIHGILHNTSLSNIEVAIRQLDKEDQEILKKQFRLSCRADTCRLWLDLLLREDD